MKNKKNKWLKVLLIIIGVVAILGIIVSSIINKVLGNIDNINELDMQYYFEEHVVKQENITSYVKGTGSITSFNIKRIEVPEYANVKESYVRDGDIVKEKQKLLKVYADGYNQNINSPIEGMYFELENNGTKEYFVYSLNDMGIELYVSETDTASLAIGQKAIIKITALNKEFEGKVTYISKLPTNGRFKVKVSVSYAEEIRFGYGASVKVIVSEKEDAIVIPYSTLQIDENNKYYVIKKENKEKFYNDNMNGTIISEEAKTYVEIGTITNNQVEILSGLQNGDVIEEWTW